MHFVKFNIDLSRRIKHNALLDCELLRGLYKPFRCQEPKFNLSSASVAEISNTYSQNNYNKQILKVTH